MAKTREGHNYRPRLQTSSCPLAPAATLAPAPRTATPSGTAASIAGQTTHSAAAIIASHAPVPAALAPHRYDTWVRPTPSSPPHLRPSQRASPPKTARTSGSDESFSSRPQELHSLPVQVLSDDFSPDLSPTSIIRRPIFHYGPIIGNSDCSTKEVHSESYYDFLAFAANPELRDSMRLVQRYSLELFMTPRRFFYSGVVIEFYNTMTSKRFHYHTAIHFSIDGREGALRATDIAATFNFPIALANSADYRLWSYPSHQ